MLVVVLLIRQTILALYSMVDLLNSPLLYPCNCITLRAAIVSTQSWRLAVISINNHPIPSTETLFIVQIRNWKAEARKGLQARLYKADHNYKDKNPLRGTSTATHS